MFASFHTCCVFGAFISFLSNCFLLGFEFWVEQLELGLDSRCLSLSDGFFTRFKEGLRGTWVCYGDLSWNSFGMLRICFCCWSLAWNPKKEPVNSSFFFVSGSKPWDSFPLLLQPYNSVIVRNLLLSVTNSMLELQIEGSMMMIRHWITENQRKLHWIRLNSLNSLDRTESLTNSFVMWRVMSGIPLFWHSALFISRQVCLWTSEMVTPVFGLKMARPCTICDLGPFCKIINLKD